MDEPAQRPTDPVSPDPPSGPPPSDTVAPGTPSVVPVDLRDYVDFSTEAARRVRVLATDHLAVDLWCLEPGQSSPVLRLPEQDVAYTVLGGRSWFVTEEGEVGLDPMGSLLVPAGIVHGVNNRAADPLIVVASITPPGAERPARPVGTEAAAVTHPEDRTNPLTRAWRRLLGVDTDVPG